MLNYLAKGFAIIGLLLTYRKPKKFNKSIITYENICTFGVNPDSLINDASSTQSLDNAIQRIRLSN